MNKLIKRIENDVQDRNSLAWKKLCDYVDKVAAKNRDEFSSQWRRTAVRRWNDGQACAQASSAGPLLSLLL